MAESGEAAPERGAAGAVGVDAGATLAKLAVEPAGRPVRYRLAPVEGLAAVADAVAAEAPAHVGLTGCAAPQLAERLAGRLATPPVRVNEFAAWGRGAGELLRQAGAPAGERYLLVSVGTGTSVMLADGLAVSRVGGTALGGGTILGLGAALLGRREFAEIAALARRGARQRVDLLVSDIYRPGEIPLAGELTAASFGRLARPSGEGGEKDPAPEDLAHALMGLVGENVALVCGGLGAAHGVRRVAFGGSTLRENPALADVLRGISAALGLAPVFLPSGEAAGALGALRLASQPTPER